MVWLCLFVLTLLISPFMSGTLYRDEDCARIRQPYHTLSEEERMLYVKGFQALRANGKLEIISTTHAANVAVHKGSSFFFFHAYMIWEAETAIRELGAEYKCFSMPYWDYTIDSGLESDPTIFHLNVGGNGINTNDFCMQDPLWQTPNYWSTDADTCQNDEIRNPPYCCLKRSVSDTQLLPNVMQIASVFLKNSNFLMFETQIDHYHVWPHFYLAVNTRSQMATAYAVDDPIFFLLHTFTLYQRALWTTCYEYDKIDAQQLQNYMNAYTPSCNPNMIDCGVVGIDAPYHLYPMDEAEWAIASKMDITPRILYNIKDWNIKYDVGPFYKNSKLNEWCEFRATHGTDIEGNDIYGPDPDLFLDLTDTYSDKTDKLLTSDLIITDLIENNYLQKFIDETWNELKSKQSELGLSNDEIYFAVESLTCKYHRSKSKNSCYNENVENLKYETCQSKNIYDKNDISLDDMLQFDGVKQNECLIKRRKQLYSVSNLDDSIKLKLCNGEYDYKCNDWIHPSFGDKQHQFMIQTGKLQLRLVSSYQSIGYNLVILFSAAVFIVIVACFVFKNWFHLGNKQQEFVDNVDIEQRQDVEYGTF